MNTLAVIGEYASVYGFAAVGLDVYPIDNVEEARETFLRLCGDGAAVIFITEQYAALLHEEIARYLESPTPAIVPIPGVSDNNGIGRRTLHEAVVKAVGSDIL